MTNYPNWPSPVAIPDNPNTPNTPKTTQQPDCPTFSVDVPQPATIQQARASGAVEGTNLVAPLAPATGPIQGPAESMVVVTVKSFWDSPTIKTARNVIGAALAAVAGVFATACMGVWVKGQSILAAGALNWRATEVSAEVAAGLIIASAILAWKKTTDNNPVK